MTPDQRATFLKHIGAGHDIETAASMAGVPHEDVQADDDLIEEANRTFKAINARLRERLLKKALESDDVRLLADLLERRETELESETAPIDPRHASRCILNKLDEFGRELGFQVHITAPEEAIIRIKTPADSELLKRLYPDSFRDEREPISFASFPSLQENSNDSHQ